MGKRKKGRAVKRNSQAALAEPETLTRAPHSFVIHRGLVGKYLKQLTMDFRKVMEPFTASSLVARKKNTIKDFVSVAGVLHVSHLVMFTCTEISGYMRVARIPQGPTLTFRIHDYTLAKEVVSSLKKPTNQSKLFNNPPLVVLNGFSAAMKLEPDSSNHMKLMVSMLQGMFPNINVTKVNINNVKRCMLFNYNAETKKIDVRHYGIHIAPVGLSKGVSKLVKGKIPNLAKYEDIADYVMNAGQLSESEGEDDPTGHVVLPQRVHSRGNLVSNKSAVRLTELGPRLSLQLLKVEGGFLDGEVMFHEFIVKTPEEIAIIEKKREERRKLKEKRKKLQEQNIREKQLKKEELKKKSLEGMEKMKEKAKLKQEGDEAGKQEEEEDDDAEWYRKEVGEEPEPDLFDKSNNQSHNKRKGVTFKYPPSKKRRTSSLADSKNKYSNSNDVRQRNKPWQQRQNFPRKKGFGSKVKKGERY